MDVLFAHQLCGKQEELIQDMNSIIQIWKKVMQDFNTSKNQPPHVIYHAPNIEQKLIIDLGNSKLDKILANDKNEIENLQKFINTQKQLDKITIEEHKENLLKRYDIDIQIEKTKNRKIWLHCGGFITIDKTEALTAIDVNTGKYTGKKDVEETILKVNEEATIEIAKQIRLRDIGGIIIIDYIDMKNQENKEKITKILEQELKKDRAKTQIEGFTKLELMELTRKHICSHQD